MLQSRNREKPVPLPQPHLCYRIPPRCRGREIENAIREFHRRCQSQPTAAPLASQSQATRTSPPAPPRPPASPRPSRKTLHLSSPPRHWPIQPIEQGRSRAVKPPSTIRTRPLRVPPATNELNYPDVANHVRVVTLDVGKPGEPGRRHALQPTFRCGKSAPCPVPSSTIGHITRG